MYEVKYDKEGTVSKEIKKCMTLPASKNKSIVGGVDSISSSSDSTKIAVSSISLSSWSLFNINGIYTSTIILYIYISIYIIQNSDRVLQ